MWIRTVSAHIFARTNQRPQPRRISTVHLAMGGVAVAFAVLAATPSGHVRADEPVRVAVTIKDHRFVPAEIHVAAGQDIALDVRNEDASAEAFDLRSLGIEEIVFPGDSEVVRIEAIKQGRYPFFGDYHSGRAKGVVVAEAALE